MKIAGFYIFFMMMLPVFGVTCVNLQEDGKCKRIERTVFAEKLVNSDLECGSFEYFGKYSRKKLLDKMHPMALANSDLLKDALDYTREIKPQKVNVVKSCDDFRLVLTHEEEIPFINENVVSLYLSMYVYSGGAHGMPSSFSVSYDRHTGAFVVWEDVFGKNEVFENYVYDRIKNELSGKSYVDFFHVESALLEFKKKGYFMIVKEGLKITFDPYEIDCYASGFREMTIGHEILKQHMDKKKYEYYFGNRFDTYIEDAHPSPKG